MYEAMVGNSRVADRPRSGAKQLVETSASDPKRSRRASSISAAEIEPKQIEWLWPGRIPANAITVLAGDPGLGKSLLTIELAARLTRGRLAPKPSSVVMLTAEDSLAHVVRPRPRLRTQTSNAFILARFIGTDRDLDPAPRGRRRIGQAGL